MEYRNPVTGEIFPTRELLVESLAESWNQMLIEKNGVMADESELIKTLNDLAGYKEMKVGKLKLSGVTSSVTIVRKTNVSYEKPKEQDHPLVVLAKKYQCLRSKIRMNVAEKGRQIEKLIEEVQGSAFPEDSEEAQAVQDILKFRKVNPGKPTICVGDQNVEDAEESETGDTAEIS